MRLHIYVFVGTVAVLAWALSPPSLAAQVGAVEGRVRDDEGSAVHGADVRLTQGATLARAARTDRLGFFRLPDVPPGTYTIRAGGFGYAELSQPLSVLAGQVVEVALVLPRRAVELEGITVGAERSRERIRFEEVGGATIREMDLVELKKVPGIAEADPLRAVEVLPGVVSTSDFSAAFHVRGGSQDQNLVLLDGVPVFSPFHLGGFFSVFNADMLDRAELQSGGFSAEHGGRVSSVLRIESDPGDGDLSVDGGVSLLASRVAVSGGAPRAMARALGLGNLHWRGAARRSYFDWLLEPAFEFPYHLQDFQGVAEGWTTGGDRIRVIAYTGDDVLDFTRLDAEDFPLRIQWGWGNDVAGVRWTRPRHGGGSMEWGVSRSGFSTDLAFPDFDDTRFRSGVSQLQGRFDWEMRPSPFLRLKVGAGAERMAYHNLTATGGTEFGRGEGTGMLLGAYGQATWSRPREWLVETGLRVDRWSPDPGVPVVETAPRLAVKRFFAGGDGALKAAVGRYTQYVHSLRDEELPLGLDIWVLAGERVPPVVSDQIQGGLEGYLGEDWFVSLEAYRRSFRGVAKFNPADDPNDPLDDILRGTGRSWGADLLVRKGQGAVGGWLAISFLKARRTFPDALSAELSPPEVTYPPVFDRRLDADLVLRYPLPWGWEGGLRWNVGTGTPYTRALGAYAAYTPRFVNREGRLEWAGSGDESDDFGGYAVFLGDRNGSRYPMYHRLDLSARKTVRKSWGTIVPYVDVVNTYNRRNVLFYFFEYSERPPVRSGVSMFPFLPTIGVEVHF